jgi:hypothetical protein
VIGVPQSTIEHRKEEIRQGRTISIRSMVIKGIFSYSDERYMIAMDFFEKDKTRELLSEYSFYYMMDVLQSRVDEKNVIFIPERRITKEYTFLFKYGIGGHEIKSFEDVLSEKEDILQSFGLQPPHLYMIASGKKIPTSLLSLEQVKKELNGKMGLNPAEIGGLIEKTKKLVSESRVTITREDLSYIIGYLLSEVNKKSLIDSIMSLGRKNELLIKMTTYDVKFFGNLLLNLLPNFENIRMILTAPTKEVSSEYYHILSSSEVFSPFMTTLPTHVVAQGVYEAIKWEPVTKKMPKGLKALIEFMDKRELLYPAIKRITYLVGNNPILALKATGIFLSRVYAYMSRRADKLEDTLGKMTNRARAYIENEFQELVSRNINIAVKNTLGADYVSKIVPPTDDYYIFELKEFIKGLSDDELHKLASVLNSKKPTYSDAVIVLLNLGAITIKKDKIYLTEIGYLLNKIVQYEVTQRKTKTHHIEEQTRNIMKEVGLSHQNDRVKE